jgi:transposase
VRETLKRFEAAGLIWPLPEMTDEALETKLFANAASKQSRRRHTEPDWAAVHRELHWKSQSRPRSSKMTPS